MHQRRDPFLSLEKRKGEREDPQASFLLQTSKKDDNYCNGGGWVGKPTTKEEGEEKRASKKTIM